jgi:hypothetical protein
MRISSEAATRGEESGARIQASGEAVVGRTVEIIGPADATYPLQNNWRERFSACLETWSCCDWET